MTDTELLAWEKEVIGFFAKGAQVLGFPRSVGQLYGLLYCREDPLCLDDVVSLLGISKGSASQGLSQLRQLGAISLIPREGVRRDFYRAEVKIKRILSGFLHNKLLPQLEEGQSRIRATADQLSGEGLTPEQLAYARDRLKLLEAWRTQIHRVLPLAIAILGKR